MIWNVTHTAWFLACPVYLAIENGAVTPIPRSAHLYYWFEAMLWAQNAINWLVSLADENAVGFWFHRVRKVEPFEIEVT